MRLIKRITSKSATVAVILALCAALIVSVLSFGLPRRAARAEDTEEFAPSSISVSNAQFTNASGTYPASPDDWTGSGSGNVISGVVDLTASVYNEGDGGNKKFKLEQYPEYSSENKIPATIFGGNDYPDTDAKALLINTVDGASVSYSYTSDEITFDPNAYYRVSAWVKTGSFAADTGATIKLSGLGEDCAFRNIDTVKDIETDADGLPKLDKNANRLGWVKYTFYVRTSSALTKSVKIVLGLGDEATGSSEDPVDGGQRPAKGYAFFDTVSADRLSATDFAFETSSFKSTSRDNLYISASGTSVALDLYEAEYLTVNDGGLEEIGTFSNGLSDWNTSARYDAQADDTYYAGQSTVTVYDSFTKIVPDDNDYGLSANPWAPLGKAEGDEGGDNPMFAGRNGNILFISTYNGNSFKPAARGVASPDVTVKRFGYYRFGVWIKTDNLSDGNGVSVAIRGQSRDASNDNELDEWFDNIDTSDALDANYGWKEYVVYIQGSAIADCDVHFELWLGIPGSQSSGIAMFDNVTFTKLSYSDYSEMSAAEGSNIITLDAAADDTGISNGDFSKVGDLADEPSFPLPAADWSYYTPSTVSATGFSKNEVNTDNVKYGIIPTDEDAFAAISSQLPSVDNPARFAEATDGNKLLLSSTTPTAFCYQSADFTVATDNSYKVTVDMAVNGVASGDYGASLVLKMNDGTVIATIENITTTYNAFKTYTFYIEAPLSDKTINVEIWLGLNDRKNNTYKLSSGNVYVQRVAAEEWTADSSSSQTLEAEYKSLLEAYTAAASIGPDALKNLGYAVYSFKAPALDYFDAYSYNLIGGYGALYQWTVASANGNTIGGIFDTDNMNGLKVYDGFDKKDQSGKMLMIFNTAPNRTSYSYGNTLPLVSNTYYRLDVTVKLRLSEAMRDSEDTVGATIEITGASNESFDNIKDTSTLVSNGNEDSRDYETFKTYTFFIATGDNGGDLGITISLGGSDESGYIQGQLIVADISLSSINNTAYDTAVTELDDSYQKAVTLSASGTSSDDDNVEAVSNDIAWWIIPTVIFSVCLLAAIVLIIVMRIRDWVKRKKKVEYSTEYDRSSVAKDIERLAKNTEEANKADKTEKEEKTDNAEIDEETEENIDNAAEEEKSEENEPETKEEPAENEKLEKKEAPSTEDLDD